MTDADALLREIVANPASDVLRLAFADAIEERRGPGDEAWAAFVRVQVRIAQLETGCPNSIRQPTFDRDEYLALQARERELWPAVRPVFEGDGIEPCYQTGLMVRQMPDGEIVPQSTVLVSRGFPAVVRCTLAEWRGGECGECGGDGWEKEDESDDDDFATITGDCPDCVKGRIPAIGPRLAQRWPIERVVTEKRPYHRPEPRDDEWL